MRQLPFRSSREERDGDDTDHGEADKGRCGWSITTEECEVVEKSVDCLHDKIFNTRHRLAILAYAMNLARLSVLRGAPPRERAWLQDNEMDRAI
jgi:hypothetical protein